MTSALNSRFELLRESGTCDPLLVQVLALLVAHANDTEAVKAGMLEAHHRGPPSVPAPQRAPTHSIAQDLRTAVPHPSASSAEALRVVQECIVEAAESSLQRYASDVRRVNDLALATLEREMQQMQARVTQTVEATLDTVSTRTSERLAAAVERHHDKWLESAGETVRELEERLETLTRSCAAYEGHLEAYGDYLAGVHGSLLSGSLLGAHRLVATSLLLEEELHSLSAASATKAEVQLLRDRLQRLERRHGTVPPAPAPPPAAARGTNGARGPGPLRREVDVASEQQANAPRHPDAPGGGTVEDVGDLTCSRHRRLRRVLVHTSSLLTGFRRSNTRRSSRTRI
eukprot:gene4993-3588_t